MNIKDDALLEYVLMSICDGYASVLNIDHFLQLSTFISKNSIKELIPLQCAILECGKKCDMYGRTFSADAFERFVTHRSNNENGMLKNLLISIIENIEKKIISLKPIITNYIMQCNKRKWILLISDMLYIIEKCGSKDIVTKQMALNILFEQFKCSKMAIINRDSKINVVDLLQVK